MSCALHFLPASTQQHPYRAAASFRPVYVDYSNKYNAGRLPPAYLRFRKDPAKYLTAYARGWVTGNLATDHDYYKRLVDILDRFHSHLVAFDVDYRLAPEYKFPHGEFSLDLGRASVGGQSAGGHLSAVVAHHCRNANIPLALQVLVLLGEFDRENCPYEPYRDMEYTIALPIARMSYLHKHFAGAPLPVLSNDPSFGLQCGINPLRDEAEVYADKLKRQTDEWN
ncbi:hypothetical protein BDW60DRAFT_216299 [Aspergillus nidulans var. acristatus]